jgi:hypothetical protein
MDHVFRLQEAIADEVLNLQQHDEKKGSSDRAHNSVNMQSPMVNQRGN